MLGEIVLEQATIELEAGDGRMKRWATLHALREIAVIARGKPEPQTALTDLLVQEMVFQAEHPAEVVARHLLSRLADLESSLRGRTNAFLSDEHARLRACLLDLQPDGQ